MQTRVISVSAVRLFWLILEVHQTAEGWMIFDVTVDGVSYMRIYHDDTDEEITQKGLDATIARLTAIDPDAIKRMQPSNTRSANVR